MRVDRTAAGYRCLLVRPGLEPGSNESSDLMRLFGADRRYATLCRVQGCFRARLTPKPWRIGLERAGLRYEPYFDGEPGLQRWIHEYRLVSEGYAVCRLVDEFGATDAASDDDASLIELHDAATRVDEDLPLA